MNVAKVKKGQLVVKILRVMGVETATIQRVERVTKDAVYLKDSSLKFSPTTLREIDQAPGFGGVADCRLVWFDDGEEKLWGLK